MARHRNVRKMNYDEECDYDDVYGRSVEEEYCISPGTAAQFMYDRSANTHDMGAYIKGESDIAEEEHESDEDAPRHQEQHKLPQLNPMDEARLRSCLEELRNVVGDNISESVLIEAVLKHNFNFEPALDAVLSAQAKPDEPKPQRERHERRPRGDESPSELSEMSETDSGYNTGSPHVIDCGCRMKNTIVPLSQAPAALALANAGGMLSGSVTAKAAKPLGLLGGTLGALQMQVPTSVLRPMEHLASSNEPSVGQPSKLCLADMASNHLGRLPPPPSVPSAMADKSLSEGVARLSLNTIAAPNQKCMALSQLIGPGFGTMNLASNRLITFTSQVPTGSGKGQVSGLGEMLPTVAFGVHSSTSETGVGFSLADLAKNHLENAPSVLPSDKSEVAPPSGHGAPTNLLKATPVKQDYESNRTVHSPDVDMDLSQALKSASQTSAMEVDVSSPQKLNQSIDDETMTDSWSPVVSPVRMAKPSLFAQVIGLHLVPHVASLLTPDAGLVVSENAASIIVPFDFSTPSPDDLVLTSRKTAQSQQAKKKSSSAERINLTARILVKSQA